MITQTAMNNNIVLEQDASDFFKEFFGPCYNALKGTSTIRSAYEHLPPTRQCQESAKFREMAERNGFGVPNLTDWNKCYICGLSLLEKPFDCEHIIDAFTGVGINSIIQGSECYKKLLLKYIDLEKDGDTSSLEYNECINAIKLYIYEYSNAHVCCNRIKLRDIWIKCEQDAYKNLVWKPDEDAIKNTLNNINKGKSLYDCGDVFGRNIIDSELRKNYIRDNYILPIITILNITSSIIVTNGINECIQFRCNQLKQLDFNLDNMIKSIISGISIAQPTPEKLIDSATIFNHIKKLIDNNSKVFIVELYEKIGERFSNIVDKTRYYKLYVNKGREPRIDNNKRFAEYLYQFYFKDRFIEVVASFKGKITEGDYSIGILKNIEDVILLVFEEEKEKEKNVLGYFPEPDDWSSFFINLNEKINSEIPKTSGGGTYKKERTLARKIKRSDSTILLKIVKTNAYYNKNITFLKNRINTDDDFINAKRYYINKSLTLLNDVFDTLNRSDLLMINYDHDYIKKYALFFLAQYITEYFNKLLLFIQYPNVPSIIKMQNTQIHRKINDSKTKRRLIKSRNFEKSASNVRPTIKFSRSLSMSHGGKGKKSKTLKKYKTHK